MEIPDDHFPYVNISAPTSPGICSPHNTLYFYSVPSSPTRETSTGTTPFGYQTDLNECPTPMSYHDANAYLDDFEFETSLSFSLDVGDRSVVHSSPFGHDRKPRQRGDSLPTTMAFADELFCDGKVMPLAPPLKLPPRLQRKRNEKLASQAETGASVPGSPSNFVLKLPFGYKRLWNDDFDPFMAALKNVKEEKKEKASAASPSYATNNQSTNEPGDEDSTTSAPEPISREMGGQIVPKRQLSQPKGVGFARQVRLIQMGQMSKLDKLGKQSERDEKAESMRKKPTFLRRLSFKSGRAAHCEEKRVSHSHPHPQLSKMALMNYKPRGLLCLGYKAS
ncbi:hypothetical protein ABKV19_000543 [Rosa sericea]